MLRFFRSIRQQLLAENKTVKYAKYAIGEFLLIVAGILVALQIQNWNEGRLDRIEEREILIRISKEIGKNMDLVISRRTSLQPKSEAINRLVGNFGTQKFKDPKAFLNDVITGSTYGWTHPKIQRYSFEEFQSAGKFALVQNKDLLNLIMDLYKNDEDFAGRADIRGSHMLNIAADLMPFQDGRASTLEENLTDNEYETIAKKVLNSDLHLHLNREQNRGEWLYKEWGEFLEAGKLLVSEIEAELNN